MKATPFGDSGFVGFVVEWSDEENKMPYRDFRADVRCCIRNIMHVEYGEPMELIRLPNDAPRSMIVLPRFGKEGGE